MLDSGRDDEVLQPGGLVVRAERDGDALLLCLYGELDLATCSQLERKLAMAEEAGTNRVVLDLSGLQFLDSTGLHTLVAVGQRWEGRDRQLTLIRGPRAVERVFELTDAARFFTFED